MPGRLPASPMGVFRALSLDLWFTTVYYETADEAAWREDRLAVLAGGLRDASGQAPPLDGIHRATEQVRGELRETGREPDTVDPREMVSAIATRLGARVIGGFEPLATAYSAAGLDRRPPRLAEGVLDVCQALDARGIPIVAITNTARREASWRAVFGRLRGPAFRHIVTSCELGRKKPDPTLFEEAARRLGVEPAAILHVGDRWELDVAGARRAGCGAVMFRGLWPRYPAAGYGEGTLPPNEGPRAAGDDGVPRIDRLEELLDESRFPFAPP